MESDIQKAPEQIIDKSSEEKLRALQEQIRKCRRCQERFGFEPRPIVYGNPGAKIVHIGQAPGLKVHNSGRPFDDASGRRLRNEWYGVDEKTFYDPDCFYFTGAGHCFPGAGKSGDRKPPACCYEMWTKKELELLSEARLYLVVGRVGASKLFGNRKLDDLVFDDLHLFGRPCFVLPHPSGRNGPWLKAHPEFEKSVLPRVRKAIQEALGGEQQDSSDMLVQRAPNEDAEVSPD